MASRAIAQPPKPPPEGQKPSPVTTSDDEHLHKKKKLVVPHSGFDFEAALKAHGFLKARQMMKQHTAAAQQMALNKLDKDEFVTRHPLRLAEAIKMSKTLGQPNSESACDKIIETAAKRVVVKEGQTEAEATRDFDVDVSLTRSMISHDASLLLAQVGLESLPNAIGDTLFLQCSYLQSVSIPRNKLTTLLSYHLPMVSMYHLRYLKELNLSGNKLKQLPAELGILSNIVELNVSYNVLGTLPGSIGKLKDMTTFIASSNNLTSLPYEMRFLSSLTNLNLTGNIFAGIPACVTVLRELKILDMSRNMLTHLGIMDALMKPNDLWYEVLDESTGKFVFCNKLTHERVKKIEAYDGKGIQRDKYIHDYQDKKYDPRQYRRRKMWLSACQIYEWDVIRDVSTGAVYFQNNVSGVSMWEMPPDVDCLGNCPALEELRLDRNTITMIPNSLAHLKTLRLLSMHTNRINQIAENWGNMQALETVDLHNNELKLLPPSFCDCKNLTNLNVAGNRLIRLPTLMGTLPKIARIDASANCMSQIPFSLGYSESLVDLNVSENPLTDPPMEEVVKGSEKLKWYLRNRLLIEQRGLPPPMEFHDMGIMHEITILQPEIREKIRYILENSMESGIVNLQLMGLTDIPRQLLKCSHIKRLQLDYNNHLKLESGFGPELQGLKNLSIKSCRIPFLPENIKNLKRLVHLNLEENMLQSLPSTISSLRSLQTLDVSKNALYSLPPGMEKFEDLRTLNLEGNRLEEVPEGFGKLKQLQVLNLGRNRISVIPDSLCSLPYLKKLNVESNCLYCLPEHIGNLPLTDLRVGHNKIEWLPYDIFEFELGKSVKLFSCCENNLTELPLSLHKIDSEALVEADFNPLISPPSYLLTEGLVTVQNYLRIRTIRLNEFEELLDAEDFEFVRANISPIACGVLADGTGFLNPVDLAEFDLATNEFLNNEYFKCPASASEIVDKLVKLREFRENELYMTCLKTLIVVLESIFADSGRSLKGFGESVLNESKRPWGRKGENQGVWVLSLNALLKDSPPNDLHRNHRPSVLSLVRDTLPEMAIPFSVDLLKDSIRLFMSPYGQVADTENIIFPQCDCVDDRNKPVRHKICEKAGVVLCQVIFNEEEVSRRELEEDEIFVEFREITAQCNVWLMTREGKNALGREVRRRLNAMSAETSLQKELQAKEEAALQVAKEWLLGLQRRKKLFDAGESSTSHGFENLQDAVNQIDEAELVVKKQEGRLAALKELRAELHAKISISHAERSKIATANLLQKYCVIKYNRMVKKYRKIAAKYGLRRPWDGENGRDYKAWYSRNIGGAPPRDAPGEGIKAEFGVAERVGKQAAKEILEAAGETEEDIAQAKREEAERAAKEATMSTLLPEYSWENTDDMKVWSCLTYERFLYSQQVIGQIEEMVEG